MGLDMYLEGDVFLWTDWKNPENNRMEDGFEMKSYRLRLGYWRKHPNLHGYIVRTFAGGEDNCQEIELTAKAIESIIEATKEKRLPPTTGFFFGESRESDDSETIKILEKALKWLSKDRKDMSKSIIYRASW